MTSTSPTTPHRPCWFVGAVYGGTDDQTARFLREGIWENGYDDRYLDEVKAMRPGDRIAVKAVFAQKRNLPFPNPAEHTVGGMYIKAIGVVADNPGNGLYIGVDWTPVNPPARLVLRPVPPDSSPNYARNILGNRCADRLQL